MEQTAAGPGLPAFDGMNLAAAKEYLFGLISALKLTEKQAEELDAELDRWTSRIELAKSRGRPDLAAEAEKEAEENKTRRERLTAEIGGLKSQIEQARRHLPMLAAKERSIDPDLLAQELLIAAGRLPGDEEKVRAENMLRDMEKDAAADAALAELKAKMEGKN